MTLTLKPIKTKSQKSTAAKAENALPIDVKATVDALVELVAKHPEIAACVLSQALAELNKPKN